MQRLRPHSELQMGARSLPVNPPSFLISQYFKVPNRHRTIHSNPHSCLTAMRAA